MAYVKLSKQTLKQTKLGVWIKTDGSWKSRLQPTFKKKRPYKELLKNKFKNM